MSPCSAIAPSPTSCAVDFVENVLGRVFVAAFVKIRIVIVHHFGVEIVLVIRSYFVPSSLAEQTDMLASS